MMLLEAIGPGKWIAPGLVDLHVHLRDPGFTHKEDIFSGCEAAKKGGFTLICCMPNTFPVVDCPEVVSYIQKTAAQIQGVDVHVVGAITKGQQGKELADIEGMAAAGICAISEDGKSVMSAALMRDAMTKAAALGLPVFSHAEDETLAGTPIGEELIVARDILLAGETGCRLHICHVSTKGSVEIIRQAKAAGIPVTAETAPHYFTLDARSVGGNTNRKMNPPLRSEEDVTAIIQGLVDGTLDVIATDHAPHTQEEKETPFDEAPNGVIGLETSFAVSYTVLVKGGHLTLEELIDKMSRNPARILGLQKTNRIEIDENGEFEITAEDFVSKSVNSPFVGMRVSGSAKLLQERT